MKYLKSFNERYTRTVGFRYSEPKIEMEMLAIYRGDLNERTLRKAFDEWDIKIGELEVSSNNIDLDIDDNYDGYFRISFFVYNDRKDDMNTLVKDIGDYLSNKEIFIKVIEFYKK